MEKLNVCLINDSFPPVIDGVANAVVNYAKIIEQNYGSSAVVTPFYPNADDHGFPFPVIRYPSVDMTKLVGYRAGMPFAPEIEARLEHAGFDIIHSHCPITSTYLARSVRERLNVPVVFTYHTKFDIDIANAIKIKALQEGAAKLLAENISACDEVWTVSHGAGENLKKLGYQGDYIVMPNGVDLPRGTVSEAQIKAATEGFDLPENIPVFLYVGRMMWYKGIRITLDALKQLKEDGRDFRMIFVGGGVDKPGIVKYSQKLGLDGKVFFAEPVHNRDRIRAWYCRADLFLFPSTFDTNGLVVREAAACALGSVLVAGSCAAEDVTDGVNGFLIEENAESMAECLKKLCADPDQMKQIGEGAQRDLYLSWEDAVKNAVERYGVVIENYKAGRCPKHERVTDEVLNTVGTFMNLIGTGDQRRKEIREQLNGLLEGKAPKKDWLLPFDASVTNEVFRPMKQEFLNFRKNMESGLADWSSEAKRRNAELSAETRRRSQELMNSIEDGLEEYFDIFL